MGDVQRIFYFHVPSAMMAFLGFLIVFVASIGFLATGRRRWDGMAQAGAEVGLLFCTITLLTGPVWARSAWGVWWTWDARLSTTLILWLLYVAYLMMRSYMSADMRMRRFSAVLGVLGALDVPIVYFSVKWWRTQHPTTFIMERGGMEPDMAVTLRVGMLAIFCLFVCLVLKRVGLERLEEARDALRAEVETAESASLGAPAGPGGAR
jgi:heme exporter protein C